MKKQLLSEELGRIKYLFNHERGVVISENRGKDKSDWGNGTSGKINLLPPPNPIDGTMSVATNILYNNGTYNMSVGSKLPNLSENSQESEDFTLDGFVLTDTSFPYPDNMIGPKFDDYPKSKNLYNTFINKLTIFINKGGLDKITSIKIQGTADAASPNQKIPRKPEQEGQEGPTESYGSLDHNLVGDSTPYGGDTNPETMNLYLANNRAKVLGQMIITAISGSTGQDITSKIVYEPGINYYGQEDKRGLKYRGVSVEPDYTPLRVRTPVTSEVNNQQSTTLTFIDLSDYGMDGKLPAIQKDRNTIAVKISDLPENLKDMPKYIGGTLYGQQQVDGKIDGSKLLINNTSFGNFIEIRPEDMGQVYDRAETSTKYITEGKLVKNGGDTEYVYIRILKFSLREI
jgi:hypothetical protein